MPKAKPTSRVVTNPETPALVAARLLHDSLDRGLAVPWAQWRLCCSREERFLLLLAQVFGSYRWWAICAFAFLHAQNFAPFSCCGRMRCLSLPSFPQRPFRMQIACPLTHEGPDIIARAISLLPIPEYIGMTSALRCFGLCLWIRFLQSWRYGRWFRV